MVARVQDRGRQALRSTRAKGPTPKLTEGQKQQVSRWIVGKDPRQYGFDFGLWTRSIIAEMIQDRFDVSLTLPSIGHLLTSLDITPQKPLRRAYERDEKEIQQWSAISAVNAKGAFWYNVYSGRLTAALFIVMLTDLMKGRKKPVMLVIDGLPVHKAKSVARYVQSTHGRLELHFLPPYAPELNPDEFAWSHLKQNGTSKKPVRKNEALRQRLEQDLAEIKDDRSLVRSFFMAPSVSYTIY